MKRLASTRFSRRAFLVVVACAMAMLAAYSTAQQPESAQLDKLGTVDFPTSGSAKAQVHFLRGVATLHSFWYEVALEEFRESIKIEPDFVMGYWGEAMAYNHPIWGDPQETEAARKVLANIRDTSKLTPRERAYVQAVQVLYGDGEKPARGRAYSAAMEKIYRDFPDDVEAALFYALSLMGTVSPEDPAGVQTRLRAGEIASEVYKKHPNHPGAAHYILHAFDDPENAPKALDAARRYAAIAPAAPHALHMPSHIFLQLGMWPEAAASNEAAWAASDTWVQQRHLPLSKRDYHSLHWLLYIYLQQGRYAKAEALLTQMRQSLAEFPKDDPRNLMFGTFTLANMAATFVVETTQWDTAEQWLGAPREQAADSQSQTSSGAHSMQTDVGVTQAPAIFARGLAIATQGSPEAQKSMAELQAMRAQQTGMQVPFITQILKMTEIQEVEIAAMAAAAQGNEAITIMRQATALDEAMPPPSGPPLVIKPAHELFGEILLRTKRPKEAAEQFATSLRRHKNRARSLLGAARAAAQSGDTQGAANFYAQFAHQWQQADAQLPELREAQDYLKQASAR
jgi:hypothetical protein